MTPEFSRPENVDSIGERERIVEIAADEGERLSLAKRFGLISIESLTARFTIRRDIAGVAAQGRVTGMVTQACSVTDDPLPAKIDEAVALRFVETAETDEEIELSEDAIDTIEIEQGMIDLGEAAAETLALALDPFPRGPGAAAVLRAAGVIGEDEIRPVNAFSGLKDKLAGK